MTIMFRTGQKVVCVNAGDLEYDNGQPWGGSETPVEGEIYTISRAHLWRGWPVVWLQEISRDLDAVFYHGPNAGYAAERFRPLVSTSTRESRQAIIDNLIKQPELV